MKKNNKKGFTLMEMLIVVAIIAILIAIAIPTFTGSMEKAREATDEANIRAAYAQVMADGMLEASAPTTASQGKIAYEYTAPTTEDGGTYKATVTATQKDTTKWESADSPTIGGQTVAASTSWTVTYTTSDGKCVIAEASSK